MNADSVESGEKLSRKERRLRWWKQKNEYTETEEAETEAETPTNEQDFQSQTSDKSTSEDTIKTTKKKKRKHKEKQPEEEELEVRSPAKKHKKHPEKKLEVKDVSKKHPEEKLEEEDPSTKHLEKKLEVKDPSKKPKKQQEKDVVVSRKNKKKKPFYVLFIGNIPYGATSEDIKNHFTECGEVHDVRLATVKETGKSRGFAYVEFKTSNSYSKGLNLHHSKMKGREINVEITSPGRGTSMLRKEFLMMKNREFRKLTNNYG